MKISVLLFSITVFLSVTCISKDLEPLPLAQKIFGNDSVPNIADYITGEYIGRPNGTDIPKGSSKKFLLLGQSENTAVVSLTTIDTTGKGIDLYLHFLKENTWKIAAVRFLSLSGIIEYKVKALERLSSKQIDSIIKNPPVETKGKKMIKFSSRDEYNFLLGNAKLTLALDDSIASHFEKNKEKFEKIKELAFKQMEKAKKGDFDVQFFKNLEKQYQKCLISSLFFGNNRLQNCLIFQIYGSFKNEVGYLYIKDKTKLPKMEPNAVIMLRELGNGWYLYKTT